MAFHIVSSDIDKVTMPDAVNVNFLMKISAVMDAASDLTALGTNYAPGSMARIVGGANYELSPSGQLSYIPIYASFCQ